MTFVSVIEAAAALRFSIAAPAVAASGQIITVRAVLSPVCAALKLIAPADLICCCGSVAYLRNSHSLTSGVAILYPLHLFLFGVLGYPE